jgi:capsular exopolysaccharide synthesis family protein
MLSVITSFKVDGKDDKELEHSRLITYRELGRLSPKYRKLRTGIQFASIDGPSHTSILITSTNPSEGKSVTAANLAVVMAQAGNSVLLIDADLRRPTQHTIFELPNNRGLTSLLLKIHANSPNGELDSLLNTFVYPAPVEGLTVMTSGPIPPNPSELLGSVKMRNTIDALTGKYDYVVIDSPPVMAVADAVVLATQVHSVVMVTEAGRTQRTPLKTSVKQLRDVKANLLGVVVNRLSAPPTITITTYQSSYYEEDGSKAGKPRTQRPEARPHSGLLNRKNKETPIGE